MKNSPQGVREGRLVVESSSTSRSRESNVYRIPCTEKQTRVNIVPRSQIDSLLRILTAADWSAMIRRV
jgi:hypothetical protein